MGLLLSKTKDAKYVVEKDQMDELASFWSKTISKPIKQWWKSIDLLWATKKIKLSPYVYIAICLKDLELYEWLWKSWKRGERGYQR